MPCPNVHRGSADKAADALAGLSGLEARLRVFTKHVASAKTLAATLVPFSFADLRANAQFVGGEGRGVRMARLTCVTP